MKTKKVMYNGKVFDINLSEEDIEKIGKEADFCKLNGFDEESFLDNLSFSYKNWKEEAIEIFRNRKAPEVKVGLGCTINLYTDRRAATVVKVLTPRKIVVKHNLTKCIDFYNSDYVVLDELDDVFEEEIYTLRKRGRWIAQGQPSKFGSVTLTLGVRHHYIDPSF